MSRITQKSRKTRKIEICSIDDIRMGNKIPHILSRYRKKSLDWNLVNIH